MQDKMESMKVQSRHLDLPLQRESGKLVEALQDLNCEVEVWKQKYIEADRRNEELPMLEISLKNASTTVADLEQRVRTILSENEKLKIQAAEKIHLLGKVQSLTKE